MELNFIHQDLKVIKICLNSLLLLLFMNPLYDVLIWIIPNNIYYLLVLLYYGIFYYLIISSIMTLDNSFI